MPHDLRLVCDHCFAFRGARTSFGRAFLFAAAARAADPIEPQPELALEPELRSFVIEHQDCRPPLRVAPADDASIEMYRENYEEA
jgi:hypothetical protein